MGESMRKFTVKRSKWLRGEGPGESYLLREWDGKMCCLGFVVEQCGIDLEYWEQSPGTIDEEHQDGIPESLLDEYGNDTPLCEDMMRVNDGTEIDDANREKTLKELAVQAGFELEFVE